MKLPDSIARVACIHMLNALPFSIRFKICRTKSVEPPLALACIIIAALPSSSVSLTDFDD